ncbi:hypothetical protein F2Q69_00029795 [Brassica cretica]|uniref:Uncharacterized protein n=1 Tax=Brassica cretica TaxID=69181 RepID=A0A8S9RTE8_BRACR|nr:hypothetical protein F2Q69_00029795 [Brassica cretica]
MIGEVEKKRKWLMRLPRRKKGVPASRVIPLGPVRQLSTSPGRALPGLDRTQYRFGVQKRQSSFRMGRESNPDGGCHHRPVMPLGQPRPDLIAFFTQCKTCTIYERSQLL